jgi:superfamily II DNA/RNA helicase
LPRLELETHDLNEYIEDQGVESEASLANARQELLWKILDAQKTQESSSSTLIFTNSIDSANQVYTFLNHEKQMSCVLYHKEVHRDERKEVLKELYEGKPLVVICTDIAARGLDTTKVCSI